MGARTLQKQCPNCEEQFSTFMSVNKTCCSAACARELAKRRRIERLSRPCEICGTTFVPKHPKTPGRFCSYKCRGVSETEERVPRGKYFAVLSHGHPNASRQGYVLEHRLVMEAMIGRYLRADEVVHHIDENPSNNSTDNLQLMTDLEHKRHHAAKRERRRGNGRFK